MVPEAGLEPARTKSPRDFKSLVSTNSTTPALTSWRRHPDSNRGWGFCRPWPYHLAMSPKIWSGKRDSNPRQLPWQGRALPLSYSRMWAWTNSEKTFSLSKQFYSLLHFFYSRYNLLSYLSALIVFMNHLILSLKTPQP